MIATARRIRRYRFVDVRSLAGVSEKTLRLWLRDRLIKSSLTPRRHPGKALAFSFRDMLVAAFVSSMRDQNVSLRTLRKAVRLIYREEATDEAPILFIAGLHVQFMSMREMRTRVDSGSLCSVVNVAAMSAALKVHLKNCRRKK